MEKSFNPTQKTPLLPDSFTPLIEQLKVSQIQLTDWQLEHNNFVPLTGCYNPGYHGSVELDTEINRFLKEEHRTVLLLLGHSGAGKSLVTQRLVVSLWESYTCGKPIPLWISLPNCKNPEERAIEETLEAAGFDEKQRETLKLTQQFIVVLDAYDEINCLKNLYVTNQLDKWNAKIIITCRHEYLYQFDEFRNLFTPYKNSTPIYTNSTVLYVNPFSNEQIEQYIKQYIKNGLNTEWKSWKQYDKAMKEIPGLMTLIEHPFVLKLAVEALPIMTKKYEGIASESDKKALTRAVLYDQFIDQWFSRQEKKLKANKMIQVDEDIKPQFLHYAKRLAQRMHKYKITQVYYDANDESALFDAEQAENPFFEFFDSENPKLQICRSACMIKEKSPKHFGFLHNSLLEYFLTTQLYGTINNSQAIPVRQLEEDDNTNANANVDVQIEKNDYFDERLLVNEKRVIQFLADRVQEDSHFKKKLLDRLFASKHNPIKKVSGANAITILVRAGVKFNGTNLSGVQIPGADLSGGYFDRVTFQGGDLSHVKLFRVWLREAILQACNLENITIGEKPWFKHEDGVKSIIYRPDLNRLVSTCKENVLVWKLDSNIVVKQFKCKMYVESIAMNQDGNIIAATDFHHIRVWNLTLENETVLPEHNGCVTSIFLSANGKFLASAEGFRGDKVTDYVVRLWDISTGTAKEFHGHQNEVTGVCLSNDGKTLASCSEDKTVRVWNVMTGHMRVLLGHTWGLTSISFCKDSKLLATGSRDTTVRVWDLGSGESRVLQGHKFSVEDVNFSDDGKLVTSVGYDKEVRVWDVNTGMCIILLGHFDTIYSVQLSNDGKTVASASQDKTVRIWEINSGSYDISPNQRKDAVNGLSLSDDGNILVSCSSNSVEIWSALTGNTKVLGSYHEILNCVDISSDGKFVVSGSGDDYGDGENTLQIWNASNGQVSILRGHYDMITGVQFSHDGLIAASSSADGSVKLWDMSNDTSQDIVNFTGKIASISMNNDATLVAYGGDQWAVLMWNAINNKTSILGMHKDRITSVHLCANGEAVVSGSDDKTVRMWNTKLAKIVDVSTYDKWFESLLEVKDSLDDGIVFRGHEGFIDCVCISNDGSTVFSGATDRTVRIWDVAQKIERKTLELNSIITSIVFHDSSGRLFIGVKDGSLQCWQRVDQLGYHWILTWHSSNMNPYLNLVHCDIRLSHGLSANNKLIVEQRGGIVPHHDQPQEATECLNHAKEQDVSMAEIYPKQARLGMFSMRNKEILPADKNLSASNANSNT